MKYSSNPFLRLTAAAAALVLATSAQAVDYTWDGGNGNWTATNWNGATATGPTSSGNTATINSGGNVTVNVGGTGSLDSITLGSGAQMNVYNGDSGIYAYTTFANLILQGGTLNGGSATYHTYGASQIGNLTVSGSAASTITSGSWFNLVPSTTFTVADVTTGADLLVNSRMYAPPLDGNDNAWGTAALTKEGLGTMRLTLGTYNVNVTVNAGTLEFVGEAEAGAGGGYGFVRNGTITVNSGATLSLTGSGTGFGWRSDNPSSITINGGTITSGTNHVFDIGGGVNMTGGLLDSTTGSFQWKGTALNTLASADTATVAGGLSLRTDFGAFTQMIDVADGAAATDLLISANINQVTAAGGITKSGAGTMVLSGTNTYTGATTVSAGKLVSSGSTATGSITVQAGAKFEFSGTSPYVGTINVNAGTLTLNNAVIDDASPIVIASGSTVNLNFTGNDTVGSLSIDGSGPLPAGTYNSSHPTYGSYFTGTGSLVIAGASGTWTSLVDGNWSTATNWQSSIIAAGYDATATFNAATGVTITLDSNRIIGNLAFDVSDYTLAGANTLTLDSSTIPAIGVGGGRTATISANLAGIYGMEKTGAGKLVLTGVKTYTGGTTVTGGTLELAGGASGNSQIRGSLSIAAGATVSITGGDGTGFGWNNPVTSVNVDGGTLNAVSGAHLGFGSFATMTLDNGATLLGNWNWNGNGLLSFASYGDSTNTIGSGSITLRGDAGANHSFTVSNGAAATDLQVDANLSDQWPAVWWVPASGLNKAGEGTMVLNGTNTYDGDTVVSDGVLAISATSNLHFRPTTNGVTNSVSGSGTSSLTFAGTVDLDLSAANATAGNVWNLFNLASFTTAPDLSSTVGVTSTLGSFSEVTAGTWELPVTNAKWVFTEADGNLAYIVTATDYDNWVTANGVTGGENGDDDSDGLTNREEYAFGLDPTGGSSVNAIAVPLDKSTGTFSYTRRTQSLTGLTYSVWYSNDLSTWAKDTGAVEGTPVVTGQVETVPVTLSSALMTNPKLFIQVRAE